MENQIINKAENTDNYTFNESIYTVMTLRPENVAVAIVAIVVGGKANVCGVYEGGAGAGEEISIIVFVFVLVEIEERVMS